jgi:putative flippase GtrA
MECCYKVFRRDVIQAIELEEDRFGFEPEVVAKVAHMRLRIFEAGVSYSGRTYQEGKKIGARDGLRALYCILRYNLHRAPVPIQFLFYLFIGAIAAGVNIMVFLAMVAAGYTIVLGAPVAFVIAASVNYVLSILLLFRRNARWNSLLELATYILVVGLVGFFDLWVTRSLISWGAGPGLSKLTASALGLILNFLGRRFLVFPEQSSGPWKPERVSKQSTVGKRTAHIDKEKILS